MAIPAMLFLPRYLDPDQPLYGFMHQGWDGKPARYRSVQEIATHYLEEMRTVQPKGPYFLGGYCFGGIVAFDMAQQLKKQKEEVALLVLLDPANPGSYQLSPSFASNNFRLVNKIVPFNDLSRHLRTLKFLRPREKLYYVRQRAKTKVKANAINTIDRGKWRLKTAACKIYLRLGYRLPPSLRSPYILGVYSQAIRSYVPEVHPGRLIVFKAAEDRDLQRWKEFAGAGLEVHEVAGSHTGIVQKPHVRVWAEKLKACLQKAQEQAPTR
jgi:thioesterase domain-containing protein